MITYFSRRLPGAIGGRLAARPIIGGIEIVAEIKYVRIQAKGQVTIPVDIRKRLGLKKGDYVAVEETPEGLLITPRGVLALKALDQMGAILREKDVTLEEWIESGREIREELYREQYGHLSAENS